jgi:hypothetical protein
VNVSGDVYEPDYRYIKTLSRQSLLRIFRLFRLDKGSELVDFTFTDTCVAYTIRQGKYTYTAEYKIEAIEWV